MLHVSQGVYAATQLTWTFFLQTWPSDALVGRSSALPGPAWGWDTLAAAEAGAASGFPQTPGRALGLGQGQA